MKMTGTQIIQSLSDHIKNEIGRHLYGVLGTYAQLESFEKVNLPHLKTADGSPVPPPIHLNDAFLAHFPDDALREVVNSEAKKPIATQDRLNRAFTNLLDVLLKKNHVLIIKQIELLFAYQVDLQILRSHAANQDHIILLLPGELTSSGVRLFTESSPHFQRDLPAQLITENHLWEITNAI